MGILARHYKKVKTVTKLIIHQLSKSRFVHKILQFDTSSNSKCQQSLVSIKPTEWVGVESHREWYVFQIQLGSMNMLKSVIGINDIIQVKGWHKFQMGFFVLTINYEPSQVIKLNNNETGSLDAMDYRLI